MINFIKRLFITEEEEKEIIKALKEQSTRYYFWISGRGPLNKKKED